MNSRLIEAAGVGFAYEERPILADLSFYVEEGESVAFVGQSGCGKTTLFRLLAGLGTCHAGRLTVNAPLSYMMQQDLLLPWRTLFQNLMLSAELCPHQKVDRTLHAQATELLQAVGLAGLGHRFPCQLSGGQRQRAALARSLLQNRPILLLDEPFGLLDPVTREQMVLLVQSMRERYGKTLLLITHDVHDALQIADRIYHLAFGQITQEWRVPQAPEARLPLRQEVYGALKKAG